jgi:hypothetical protein
VVGAVPPPRTAACAAVLPSSPQAADPVAAEAWHKLCVWARAYAATASAASWHRAMLHPSGIIASRGTPVHDAGTALAA